MSGRDVVLGRVRAALSGVDPAPVVGARDYDLPPDAAGEPSTIDLFVERLGGYDATVHRASAGDIAVTVAAALTARGLRRVIVPEGLDDSCLPTAGFEWIRDDPPLSTDAIAAADGVVTAAAVGVADSGTLVLDGGAGQGRRVLSLLPDAMLVIIPADRVVAALPSAIAHLDPTRPMTFVSGPSATVDIELVRVGGVHGPRALDVVVLEG
ncbi:LutC/YkgG family protein [Speluncibacter jeojiensis]|uniref:LUD domain-containing protein n=1 Tax=Speluncibacter jeojiensis TaxID=2710754 RepID=A0A9X4RFI6_9ACTN|nr:LUD domain-containing protein [Corynebacteriales bacterium D3-21]